MTSLPMFFRCTDRMMRSVLAAAVVLLAGVGIVRAEEIGCTSTTFRLLSPNDKICVSAFDDPKIPGVTCHVSQARTGGYKGALGLAEDPSRFSIACRQTGPIVLPAKVPAEDDVFSEGTSLLFKRTKVVRMFDQKRNTLVYVAISKRVVDGSPMNSISTVTILPWPSAR
jgi:CreA protein